MMNDLNEIEKSKVFHQSIYSTLEIKRTTSEIWNFWPPLEVGSFVWKDLLQRC